MTEFSIEKSRDTVLRPNSEFERRVIFQYYLDNDISINSREAEILNICVAKEPESIGIIGCLLRDDSFLNTLRLAIGAKNKSNLKLANLSNKILLNKSIKDADYYYSVERDYNDMTDVEKDVEQVYNSIYY